MRTRSTLRAVTVRPGPICARGFVIALAAPVLPRKRMTTRWSSPTFESWRCTVPTFAFSVSIVLKYSLLAYTSTVSPSTHWLLRAESQWSTPARSSLRRFTLRPRGRGARGPRKLCCGTGASPTGRFAATGTSRPASAPAVTAGRRVPRSSSAAWPTTPHGSLPVGSVSQPPLRRRPEQAGKASTTTSSSDNEAGAVRSMPPPYCPRAPVKRRIPAFFTASGAAGGGA